MGQGRNGPKDEQRNLMEVVETYNGQVPSINNPQPLVALKIRSFREGLPRHVSREN